MANDRPSVFRIQINDQIGHLQKRKKTHTPFGVGFFVHHLSGEIESLLLGVE